MSSPSRRRSRSTPTAKRGAKAKPAAAAAGPLTLEEAKRVAPSAPARRATRAALATATPNDIGVARHRLAARQRDETKERIRAYRATLRLLEQRGFALHSHTPGTARAAAAGAPPLRILAEGDSWFDYPVLLAGGLIPRLEDRIGVPILNLAQAGDEVRFMLGVKQRERLEKLVGEAAQQGEPWDALLFSGGGNDIVDNPMCLWIRDYDASQTPAWHLDAARFQAALDIVRAGYEDLIKLRGRLSKETTIFLHAYDFAIPDGRGVCHLGPWMRPTFKYRKFPSKVEGARVVKVMLQLFEGMLKSLALQHPNVVFIPGQGTLDAHPDWWHNELHPNGKGFDLFVENFRNALKSVFPTRVR